MNSKLISLGVAAAIALTGTSAYAVSAGEAIARMEAAKPLKMGVEDSEGLTKYKGKTVIAGVLEYNLNTESGCPTCIQVSVDSNAMIPKKNMQGEYIEFGVPSDNPNIKALKLDENKCFLVPMIAEIDGYYSDSYEGGQDGANLIEILRKSKIVPTSCN